MHYFFFLLLLFQKCNNIAQVHQWNSHTDIALFESGVCSYGKDFASIQKNVLPHKTVNEIVAFFYTWKKGSHYYMWKSFKKPSKEVDPAVF